MTDIFTQDIKDLIKLATTDFNKFYQEAEKQNKSSGNYSTAASSGNYSKAASSGNSSKAASSGYSSACSALGYMAAVKGDLNNLLMCSEYSREYKPIGGLCAIVDGEKIKVNQWYIVKDGKWVAVDFSDGIFSYVISERKGIKKLKFENGAISYLATSDCGKYTAHGKTAKEACEELTFKMSDRGDLSDLANMPLDTTKTVREWGFVYRRATGACQTGTEHFIKLNANKEKYTLAEILEATKNAYWAINLKK